MSVSRAYKSRRVEAVFTLFLLLWSTIVMSHSSYARQLEFEHVYIANVHAITASDSQVLFAATEGGTILKSVDLGKSWNAFFVSPDVTTEIHDVDVESNESILFNQNGIIQRLNLASSTVDTVYSGAAEIVLLSDSTFLASYQSKLLKVSQNGQQSTVVLEFNNCGTPTIVPPQSQSNSVFLTQSCGIEGESGYLYASHDNGLQWSTLIPGTMSVLDILFLSEDRQLIGSNLGLFTTSDFGVTRSEVTGGNGPAGGFSIAADGTIYALLDSNPTFVIKSGDDGDTWIFEGVSLNASGLSTIVVEDFLLAYGSQGIFRSSTIISTGVHVETAIRPSSISGFSIFPNPTNSKAILVMDHAPIAPLTVTVTDSIGRQVHEFAILSGSGDKIVIDLTNQANGLYFVVISNRSFRIAKSLIKTN